MKVTEIITERQQLNEFAPLVIAGATFTWASVVTAITTLFAGYSAYQVYDVLAKHQFDLETMTDDDWFTVFIYSLGIASPFIAKFGLSKVARYVPSSVKSKGIELVKSIFKKKLTPSEYRRIKREQQAAYRANRITPRDTARVKLNKLKEMAKADRAAKAAAGSVVSRMKSSAWKLLLAAGLGSVAYDYYTQMAYLEQQYKLEMSAPSTSEVFGQFNGDRAKSAEEFRTLADIALGEAIAKLGILIVPSMGAAVFKALGAVTSFIPLVGRTSKLISDLLAWSSNGAISKATRVALFAWFETEDGKAFLKHILTAALFNFVGSTARTVLEKAASVMQSYTGIVGDAGAALGSATTALTKGEIKLGVTPQQQATNAIAARINQDNTPADLRVRADSRNPKIWYVGEIQVTTPNGFLDPNMSNAIKRIARNAEISNIPNPIEQLGLRYA